LQGVLKEKKGGGWPVSPLGNAAQARDLRPDQISQFFKPA